MEYVSSVYQSNNIYRSDYIAMIHYPHLPLSSNDSVVAVGWFVGVYLLHPSIHKLLGSFKRLVCLEFLQGVLADTKKFSKSPCETGGRVAKSAHHCFAGTS